MKKILLKLLVIIAIMFITDRGFDYFFTNYIFTKTLSGESGGGVNYLLQKKSSIDFVILGSSRAKHQLDPAVLRTLYSGNGYNAGINGLGGIFYNDELLHILLENNVHPKTIVLQMDAAPYFVKEDENNTRELLPLYPYIGKSNYLQQTIKKNVGFAERFLLIFHSYRYNGKLLNIFFNYVKRNGISDNNGFADLQGKLDTTTFTIIDRHYENKKLIASKLEALNNIMRTCRENKLELIVVFPPTYKNNDLYSQGTDSLVSLLQQNNIRRVYDFSDVTKYPALQPADMWKDASHLNDKGAHAFSLLLNDAIAAH